MNITLVRCVVKAAHAAGFYDITQKEVVRLYNKRISKQLKTRFEDSYGSGGYRLSDKVKMLTTEQYMQFCNGHTKLNNCKNPEIVEQIFENFDDLFRGYK